MEKRFRRLLSAAMALSMTFSLSAVGTGTAAFAAEEAAVSADAAAVTSGSFTYVPKAGAEPVTDSFYYSDSYFGESSDKLNEHLAAMSMALAFSTFEESGSSYVRKLYSDIGFTDISIADMDEAPERDTIGTAIAHKKADGKDVIAVAIRGSRYHKEWASVLTAGAEGDIEGFSKASEKVIARIKQYIADNGLSDVKLWITGYSKAGAVADLTGVYINEHSGEFSTAPSSTYVYTFETPRCSVNQTVCDNIWIFLNRNDPVSYVYPEKWGVYRNGRVILLGGDKTVMSKKIHITHDEKVNDLGEMPMDEFLTDFFDFITDDITREVYSGECDDAVANIVELLANKKPDELQAIANYFKGDFLTAAQSDEHNDHFMYTLMSVYSGISTHNSDAMYRQSADELIKLIDEVSQTAPPPLTNEEMQVIKDNLYPVLRALGPTLVKDSVYAIGIDYDSELPEDYNDPDYDPQTADEGSRIMTYEQYLEALKKMEEESEAEKAAMSDEERGYEAGSDISWSVGYEDGKANAYKANYNDVCGDGEEHSAEYLTAYAQGYSEGYERGFESGKESYDYDNNRTAAEIGADEGRSNGWNAAFTDAQLGEEHYRESFDDTPLPPDEGDTKLSEEYKAAYREAYSESYNSTFYEELETQKMLAAQRPLYHLGTFLLNAGAILNEHMPQTNLELVKGMDSYYSELNSGELTVPYLSGDGSADTVRAKLLSGTETELEGGWYAVTSPLTYDHTLTIKSDVSLIVTDGSSLTIASDGDAVSGGYALSIYGQSDDWGSVDISGGSSAISTDSYLQYGSSVKLSASKDYYSLKTKNGIVFGGGSLVTEQGIRTDGSVTLDYQYESDYIRAGAYSVGSSGYADIAEGKAFYAPDAPRVLSADSLGGKIVLTFDGTEKQPTSADVTESLSYILPTLKGRLSEEDIQSLAGKRLAPYVGSEDALVPLTEEDFELDNVKSGTACSKYGYTFSIIGKGSYSGTAALRWYIDPSDAPAEGQIASDKQLTEWSEKDCQNRVGKALNAYPAAKQDGKLTIKLIDNLNKEVDTYVIDTADGTGTASDGTVSDLPQTGMSSLNKLLIALAATLTGAGTIAVAASSADRRRAKK